MSKSVMKIPFMGLWLTVDQLAGYGTEYANMSLRESNDKGLPGKRIRANFGVRRSEVIAMAFRLLDVADMMQPDSTYATSDSVHSSKGESVPAHDGFNTLRREVRPVDIDEIDGRKRDVAERFERLRRRLPTLQLAQRVLERCDDDVAQTLTALLMMADQAGDLPLRAELQVVPAAEGIRGDADFVLECATTNTKH